MEQEITETRQDYIAKQIGKKVAEQVTASWGIVLTELQNTQESNRKVNTRLDALEEKLNTQTAEVSENLKTLIMELQKTREQQRKAAEILAVASKELGISE